MAKDYKTRRSRDNGFSGWLGLSLGLALGLAIAVGIYVKDHRPETASKTVPSRHDKKKPADAEAPDEEPPGRRPLSAHRRKGTAPTQG